MRYRSTGRSPYRSNICSNANVCLAGRYEIADGGADWADAERQVRSSKGDSNKALTVSVKSGKSSSKRKAGEAIEEAYKEEIAAKEGKKARKSGGKKGR